MQGKEGFVNDFYSRITSFRSKLQLFKQQLKKRPSELTHFPNLNSIFQKIPLKNRNLKLESYCANIDILFVDFKNRFADFDQFAPTLRIFETPFDVESIQIPAHLQLEILDLQSNNLEKSKFNFSTLFEFYKNMNRLKYPNLATFAIKIMSFFSSTYLCEQTFSRMNITKNNLRGKISDENLHNCLLISTTATEPNIEKIIENKKQIHSSH